MPLRYRSLMVLAAVLFGQLLLMAYQLRRNQDIPIVRGSVVYVVGPIQREANAAVRAVHGVWDGYVYLWATRRQNQALQGKLDALTLENQRLREQAAEGRRLQVLFDLRQQVPLPTVAAQVLSTGSSETARIVLIDKGSNAGLQPDFPVMVPEGVVGKVLHVFPNTAQVLLLTDPYSGVACLLEGSRVHGILKGLNKPLTTLTYVPNGEDVKPGQRVLTSGEDQIYPKGLPVGVILDARPGPEFMQVTVQPLAPLNRLEDVLVILQSGGDLSAAPIAFRASPESGPAPAAPATPPSPAPSAMAPPTPSPNTAASPSPALPAASPAASSASKAVPPAPNQPSAAPSPLRSPLPPPASAPVPNPKPATPPAGTTPAPAVP